MVSALVMGEYQAFGMSNEVCEVLFLDVPCGCSHTYSVPVKTKLFTRNLLSSSCMQSG